MTEPDEFELQTQTISAQEIGVLDLALLEVGSLKAENHALRARLRLAIAREREACARIVEECPGIHTSLIAQVIRARGLP